MLTLQHRLKINNSPDLLRSRLQPTSTHLLPRRTFYVQKIILAIVVLIAFILILSAM